MGRFYAKDSSPLDQASCVSCLTSLFACRHNVDWWRDIHSPHVRRHMVGISKPARDREHNSSRASSPRAKEPNMLWRPSALGSTVVPREESTPTASVKEDSRALGVQRVSDNLPPPGIAVAKDGILDSTKPAANPPWWTHRR